MTSLEESSFEAESHCSHVLSVIYLSACMGITRSSNLTESRRRHSLHLRSKRRSIESQSRLHAIQIRPKRHQHQLCGYPFRSYPLFTTYIELTPCYLPTRCRPHISDRIEISFALRNHSTPHSRSRQLATFLESPRHPPRDYYLYLTPFRLSPYALFRLSPDYTSASQHTLNFGLSLRQSKAIV